MHNKDKNKVFKEKLKGRERGILASIHKAINQGDLYNNATISKQEKLDFDFQRYI